MAIPRPCHPVAAGEDPAAWRELLRGTEILACGLRTTSYGLSRTLQDAATGRR